MPDPVEEMMDEVDERDCISAMVRYLGISWAEAEVVAADLYFKYVKSTEKAG